MDHEKPKSFTFDQMLKMERLLYQIFWEMKHITILGVSFQAIFPFQAKIDQTDDYMN